MRPFAGRRLEVPFSLLAELNNYLHHSDSKLSPVEVLVQAVRAWIDNDRATQPDRNESARGYQWKSLFLPHSTELSMVCDEQTYVARVVGDDEQRALV